MDLPPKAKEIKAKINKWDLINLKNICEAKKTIDEMKRQLTDWEKIFSSDMTNKVLISNICKQFIQLKNFFKKPSNSIKKWADELNRL